MTPEFRWLVGCLRFLAGGSPAGPCPAGLDWEGVLSLAETEGLAPALGFALDGGDVATPAAVRARLRRRVAESRARHLLMSRGLARVLAGLDTAGVPAIVLKGPVLAETIYPDPGLRPFSDLDLLIRPVDLARADDLLLRLDHVRVADAHSFSFDRAYDGATLYEAPDGVRVDLHWRLLTEPRFAWNDDEAAAVWERAVAVPVAGRTALGLGPEDLVLFLAAHLAVHHALAGLLWHWDLALLLARRGPSVDWDVVVSRATRWRVRRSLFFALENVARLFDVRAPASAMAALAPRGMRAAVAAGLLRRPSVRHHPRFEYLLPLLLIDRGRDLAEPLRQIVCPPTDWLRARYGAEAGSVPALYLAHYRRMGRVLRGTRDELTPAVSHDGGSPTARSRSTSTSG